VVTHLIEDEEDLMGFRRLRLAQRRKAAGYSQEAFAEAVGVARTTVNRWECAQSEPQPWQRPKIASKLNISTEGLEALLVDVVQVDDTTPNMIDDPSNNRTTFATPGTVNLIDDELETMELARRVDASDVSDGTLTRLEQAADELAMAYATASPEELIPRIRKHLAYVARLVDARKTLVQQRRLLVVSGWLSLLGATVHIDLRQQGAAEARLTVARQLAEHAEHREIHAWCLETRAWDVLTAGNYRQALQLSQQAQALAPRGSSAHIQATAQEGRAWARMGNSRQTRDALDRMVKLVGPLAVPEHPEHHYQYDPGKAMAYTATTLAWVGDPAAVEFASAVIEQLQANADGVPRPRRAASARLDLGLALLAAGRPDEASSEALAAITSGRVVASNWWRATEVMVGVQRAEIGEAAELREAYETYAPGGDRGRLVLSTPPADRRGHARQQSSSPITRRDSASAVRLR
jgi:DNA-binding XRE family transcriptional regulator/tetratricopeptide (TPR) repeat protein